MSIFSLRTGKPLEQPQAQVVSDLDAMVAHPVAFRLHGKVHFIKPITVKEFYAFTNAINSINALEKQEHVTSGQVLEMYEKLICSVCDSVTRKDVENLTQAQCGALLNLIIECVTGKAQVDSVQAGASEEKKNSLIPPSLSLQYPPPSRLRKVVSFLAGLLPKF